MGVSEDSGSCKLGMTEVLLWPLVLGEGRGLDCVGQASGRSDAILALRAGCMDLGGLSHLWESVFTCAVGSPLPLLRAGEGMGGTWKGGRVRVQGEHGGPHPS